MNYKALHSFYSGLNQDLGYDKLQNSFYYSMLNGSIITDESLNSSNPTNISGNKLFVTIPDTYTLFKGQDNTLQSEAPYDFTLTISGVPLPQFTGTFSDSASLFALIKASILSNSLLQAINIRVSYSSTEIFIWSTTQNITITTGVNINQFNFLNTVGTGTGNAWIPQQSNLKIVGWGLIRDAIYLLTTNETTQSPISSFSQVWKLTYSKISLVPTITLIYNSTLNLTTAHPFPNPGGVVGIYENLNIQRLYLTDNFNRLRQINVQDPDLMSLDPDTTNVIPSISFNIPILQKVIPKGSLELGVYQACYRLSNPNGAVSSISSVSNLVYIVQEDEADSTLEFGFVDYVGNVQGTPTNKAIQWRITNIDPSFTQIEIIILKRVTKDQIPEIFVLPAQSTPSDGSYEFTYFGNESITTLTLPEFNTLSGTFTHCKAIAAKDSILFAANTRRAGGGDLDYDARAYRFNSTPSLDLINSGLSVNYPLGNYPNNGTEETIDAINPNHDLYRFQANGTTLGGQGPNISYEFGTIAVRGDSHIQIPGVISQTEKLNIQRTIPDNTITFLEFDVLNNDNSTLQEHPTNKVRSGLKTTYYSSCLKDYQREEIYRLGIEFSDTSGFPYFTKWIGDIKMPGIYDVNTNAFYEDGSVVASMGTGVNDFRLSFVANRLGLDECFVNHMFIKFTIFIPQALRSKIGGYEIKRVQRTQSDKTILGMGLVTPTQYGGTVFAGPADKLYSPYVEPLFDNFFQANLEGTNGGELDTKRYMFDSPDFLLEGFPGYVQGDELRITSKISSTEFQACDPTPTIPFEERYKMAKYYEFEPLIGTINNNPIEVATYLVTGQQYYLQGIGSTGIQFHNFTRDFIAPTFHTAGGNSYGAPTLLLELNNNLQTSYVGGYLCKAINGDKLLGVYYRPNSNQYGGASYSARTLNEYISCGMFRGMDKVTSVNPGTFVDTVQIFGGDIFTSIYDEQKYIKFWSNSTQPGIVTPYDGPASDPTQTIIAVGAEKSSYSIFFPCQSGSHSDLRHGYHPNVNIHGNTGVLPLDTAALETLFYNSVFSAENNIKLSFPKPLNFLTTDENDNRIYASQVKINGETQDSWSVFRANDYIDVDGIYGPINQLISWNNKLIFWQDRGTGTAAVNEREIVQGVSGSELAVGSGGILDRVDYISTTGGSKHQFSFSVGPDGIWYMDILNKSFEHLSSEGIRQVQGLDGYLGTHLVNNILEYDNPYIFAGCTSTYDYNFKQFVSSINNSSLGDIDDISQDGFCLSYLPQINQNRGGFHSFYSYRTPVFINDKQNLFNVSSDLHSIWIMNEGPKGSFFNSIGSFKVDFICNEHPASEKVFDNLEINSTSFNSGGVTNDELPFIIDQRLNTFSRYRCFNSYQNSNYIPINPQTVRRVRRTWNLKIGGNRCRYLNGTNFNIFQPANLFTYPDRPNFPSRLKSNYLFINLEYDNSQDNKLTLESAGVIYRINSSKPTKP